MSYDRTVALIEKLEKSIEHARERFAERDRSPVHLSMALSAAKSVRLAAGRLERHLRDEANAAFDAAHECALDVTPEV